MDKHDMLADTMQDYEALSAVLYRMSDLPTGELDDTSYGILKGAIDALRARERELFSLTVKLETEIQEEESA